MVDPAGVSIVNADDPSSAAMAHRSRARVVTYGIDGPAEIRATEVRLAPTGTQCTVAWPEGRRRVSLRLPGLFNVSNALAAVAAGLPAGARPAATGGGGAAAGRV